MNKTKQSAINIADIRIDGGTQQRESINPEIVSEYAEAMRCGAHFPSVVVFYDGANYWLADGFHRFHACREAPVPDIDAEIHTGTQRDAVLYSTGANNTHGQRLTNADKRKAVGIMIADKEWGHWTDEKIAKHCKVTRQLVWKMREESRGKVLMINKSPPKPAPIIEIENPAEDYTAADAAADELSEAHEAIKSLSDQIDMLKDQSAVAALPKEEQKTTAEIISDLRAQIVTLEAENRALKASRDKYQSENAELKKQCQMQRKQIDKLKA